MANYDERQEEKKRLARETQVGIPCVFLFVKGTTLKTKIQPEHRPKPQKERIVFLSIIFQGLC